MVLIMSRLISVWTFLFLLLNKLTDYNEMEIKMLFFIDKKDEFLNHISYSISKYYVLKNGNDFMLLITSKGEIPDFTVKSLTDLGCNELNQSLDYNLLSYTYKPLNKHYYIWLVDDVDFIKDASDVFSDCLKDIPIIDIVRLFKYLKEEIFDVGGESRITINDIQDEKTDNEKIKEMLLERDASINKAYLQYKETILRQREIARVLSYARNAY